MSVDVDSKLRGPEAYALARQTLETMERRRVWPTPVNFELWAHVVADPEGALAKEVERLLASGEPFTDLLADELTAAYLPKGRLNDHIRDAGDALSKELVAISQAIAKAQKSSSAYGETLATASQSLTVASGARELKRMVDSLAAATRLVQAENQLLESRLSDSTAEVAKLREHLELARREATTDGLTKLANRRAFDEEISRLCREADANGEPLSLALLDIDHFKRFNDTWGHQTGDQVLRYVASVIAQIGAPPRVAARYGGEEFAMLFPGEEAASVAAILEEAREEIASRMLKRRSTKDDLGTITVSAGLTQRHHGEPLSSLMERADRALYASKHAGRNRVTTDALPAAAA
jgi:diguanylate cyclase